MATGAQRPRGRYGGTLEPLNYIRVWVFERENRDLLRLNSAELVESFFEMQRDYRIQVAAQFLAEVGEHLLEGQDRDDGERDGKDDDPCRGVDRVGPIAHRPHDDERHEARGNEERPQDEDELGGGHEREDTPNPNAGGYDALV